MSRLMIALCVAGGMSVAATSMAAPDASTPPASPMTKAAYTKAGETLTAQHVMDRKACGSLSGNTEDICLAQAVGRHEIAKAELEAAYDNTAKTREAARVTRAEADYKVALEKCDDLSGNPKDVCVKESDALRVKSIGAARIDRVDVDSRNDAALEQSEVREDANIDTRDANYEVAIEKCDALAGAVKDACESNAKMRFGKS